MASRSATFNREGSNDLEFTQSVFRVHPGIAESVLVFTQSASVDPLQTKIVYSDLYFTQQATVNKTISLTVEQTLTFTQAAFKVYELEATNTLAFTQSTSKYTHKPAINTLAFTQTATYSAIRNRTAASTLTFSQNAASRVLIGNREASNTLNLTQTASVVKVMVREASNDLEFTQYVIREAFNEFAQSTLVFTQEASCIKRMDRSSTSILTISQNTQLSRTLNLIATNTLEFPENRQVLFSPGIYVWVHNAMATVTNPNGLTNARIRQLIENDSTGLMASAAQEYDPAVVDSVGLVVTMLQQGILLDSVGLSRTIPYLVGSNNYVSLWTDSEAIVLPAPQFGNSEALTHTISARKAMDDTLYTYVKRSHTRRIKYDFRLDRQKSLQLRNYLLSANSKLMDMANWKGERWKVRLTTNPFVFTKVARSGPTGEKVTISLEFEGLRIT